MAELPSRKPISHPPTASFTMKRGEHKANEDLRLVSHFASWLSKVSNRNITEENFESDLMDGVALLTVMQKLQGSQVEIFHDPKPGALDFTFKAKENMVTFQLGAKNLNLPVSFGTEDLEKKNIGRIVSTLIFLAHVAHSQGVTVKEMDQEILDKVEEVDESLKEQAGNVPDTSNLTWYQALMVKFGLGEWIDSISVEAIKQYLATLKKNIEDKLPENIKSRLNPPEPAKAIE